MPGNHKIDVTIGTSNNLMCSENGSTPVDCTQFYGSMAMHTHAFTWCSDDGQLSWTWKGDGTAADGASPFANDPHPNHARCTAPPSIVSYSTMNGQHTWKYDLTLTTLSGGSIESITSDPKVIVDNGSSIWWFARSHSLASTALLLLLVLFGVWFAIRRRASARTS